MKEQLISFETAKLAKEKGFDEECNHSFNKTKVIRQECNRNYLFFLPECSAPTQSLLQKWLREEHQLYVMIEETHTYALRTQIGFYAKIVTPSGEDEFDEHGFRFIKKLFYDTWFDSTYENALEKGLEEALKLIK